MTRPTTSSSCSLTDEERETYARDGFVVVRDVVPADVRAGMQDVLSGEVDRLAGQWRNEGLIDDTHDDLPFETRYAALRRQLPPRVSTAWRKALISRPIYELWQRPELLDRVRSLVGDEVYAHGIWSARPRSPGAAVQKVFWHQDAHYYKDWQPTDGKLVSVWFPLVPVDEQSGCLQYMPGSHRRGWIPRIQGWIEETGGSSTLFTVPDEELRDFTPRSAVMNPGDVVLFADTVLHQSLDNVSDYVRWSVDLRFAEATDEIIRKTPTGYYCFSASDPSRVESYETWTARYDYSAAELDAELENSAASSVDLGELARRLGTSRTEFELY